MNYLAADKVVQKLSDTDQKLLSAIFQIDNINVGDNVLEIATRLRVDSTKLWSLVSAITTKVAKERRLL
jgi:hypothetical protein